MEPEPQSTATENGGATQEALRKRWRLVKTILQECLEVPAVHRAGLLASRCEGDPALLQEVRELLAASEASTGFLETPVFAGKLTIPDADAGMLPDGLIGPYRVISEIGRGGLGVVYRAVRDDGQYAQEVALKLVKRGMDTERVLSRFRLERQLLAFLNHPNIGRLLDGGSTDDGRPYFVMELIDGVPISTYCETQGLDRLQRLELFRRVCGAVEYAHRNLIVHRDLKPGNILVTAEGEPKLLDFGIAKLVLPDVDGDSVPETISTHLMTPDYASPEQVRGGHVDTTTDVYSLGAVLYELLTGRRAHQLAGRSLPEIHQVVCERDPIRPSAAVREGDAPHPTLRARFLAGDLDRIVMRALHKEADRRYASVEQFSEDIRRYLEGLPVLAVDDSLAYRARKFARRNRAVVLATVAVLVTLAAGVIATAWQAHVARRERDRAQRRFEDVRQLANSFLVQSDLIASLPGGTALRTELVGNALQYLDRVSHDTEGDAALQEELARAYERMGDVQGRQDGPHLGDTAGALASYRKAVQLREEMARVHPDEPRYVRGLASAYSRLSGVLKISGDYQGGLDHDRKALALHSALAARDTATREDRRALAASYTDLGGGLSHLGDWKGVLEARQKSLAMYEQLAQEPEADVDDYRGLCLAYTRMGSILMRLGKSEAAVPAHQKAVETATRALERFPRHFGVMTLRAGALSSLGNTCLELKQFPAARQHLEQAHAAYLELAAADPKDARTQSFLSTSYYRLGQLLLATGAASRAFPHLRESLAIRQRLAAANPANAGASGQVAESWAALGEALAAVSRPREALQSYTQAQTLLLALESQGRINDASRFELERVNAALARLKPVPAEAPIKSMLSSASPSPGK